MSNKFIQQAIRFSDNHTPLLRGLGVCASLAIGVLVYVQGKAMLDLTAQNQFANDSREAAKQIETNFDKYYTVLSGLKAFITTNPNSTPEDFKQYVDSLNIIKNYPGFQSLNYAKYFDIEEKNSQISQLKTEMSSYIYKDNELLDKVFKSIDSNHNKFGIEKEAFMINRIEPVERNIDVIGKNLSNSKPQHNVLKNSLQTGTITQSGRLFIIIENNKPKAWAIGFRIPVIVNNDYLGSVGASVNYAEVINESFKSTKKGLSYNVYDKTNDVKRLILDPDNIEKSLENNGEGIKSLSPDIPAPPEFTYNTTFKVNERVFDISFYTTKPELYASTTDDKLLIFSSILSSILSLSLWIMFLNLFTERNKAKSMAQVMTKDLAKLAWYDSLTGLNNRAHFLKLIEDKIKTAPDKDFTVYFIDLDGFKRVNDTLGHHAGDKVLKEYSDRLQLVFSIYSGTEIARIGGDEFVIVIDGVHNIKDWVKEIQKATQEPFEVDNHKFLLSQSIGIAKYPKDGQESESLLRKSDIAMYAAKTSDTEEYMVYTDALGQEMVEKNKMENDLRYSILNKELYLVFQPKMKFQDGRYQLAGFEALMRWNSPIWGQVPPVKFIEIAEKNGFVDEMTRWLLRETCDTIKYLQKELGMKLPISLNLSGRQFISSYLSDEFLEIIKEKDIDFTSMVLEITESTIMKQPETAKKIIEKYRSHNLKISLDDFGTGYSSFSYLSQFIVDEIKIDRSFITNVHSRSSDKALVEAIILMAQKLKLEVVAEGVETKEQLDYLVSINCDYFQGYYFSKPILLAEVKAYKDLFD